MLDDNFAKWLQTEKNMGVKSARDVISRCRRIQLVFKISLDKEVKNSKDAKINSTALFEVLAVKRNFFLYLGCIQGYILLHTPLV